MDIKQQRLPSATNSNTVDCGENSLNKLSCPKTIGVSAFASNLAERAKQNPAPLEQAKSIIEDVLGKVSYSDSWVSHSGRCFETSKNWSTVEELTELGMTRVKSNSSLLTNSGSGVTTNTHYYHKLPGDIFFDPTYRQFFHGGNDVARQESLPAYFLGTRNELEKLFQQNADILSPHVAGNMEKTFGAKPFTSEQIKQLVSEIYY